MIEEMVCVIFFLKILIKAAFLHILHKVQLTHCFNRIVEKSFQLIKEPGLRILSSEDLQTFDHRGDTKLSGTFRKKIKNAWNYQEEISTLG